MANWEQGTVLALRIRTGYQLQTLSPYPAEGEVLLPPHEQFVVSGELDVVQLEDATGVMHDIRVIPLMQIDTAVKKLVS